MSSLQKTPKRVSREDMDAAMRLLGLDPDHEEYSLITVSIEAGTITATYAQVVKIGPTR